MAGSPPTVSWSAANGRRLARHALLEPVPAGTGPAEIAAAVCGAHAQVLSAAEVSLALRIDGATRADVRHALWEDRSLVKTFGPRGTSTCWRPGTFPCGRAGSRPSRARARSRRACA